MVIIFGYIRINKMDLTYREFENYKSFYCGLCKILKRDYTEVSRLSINYDITFLILVLTSVYLPKSEIFYEKCVVSPIKKKPHLQNEFTEYAAAMNVLLTYGKLEDNVRDSGGIKDRFLRRAYKTTYIKAKNKYPHKADIIKYYLDELNKLEIEGCTSIDHTSNTFGNIMREVFMYKEDKYKDILGELGFNLGKYIYILDAFEDLDKDIESGEYNPFKEYRDNIEELEKRVERNILMCLSKTENAIEKLDIRINKRIIDNIIYSGVYLRFKGILARKSRSNQGEIKSNI